MHARTRFSLLAETAIEPHMGLATSPRICDTAAKSGGCALIKRSGFWAVGAACLVLGSGAASAQERLPTIPPGKYDDAQKKAADDFLGQRKTPVFGPFEPLMHSPEVMSDASSMGAYLRYKSGVGGLSELVILIIARDWSQDYEWHVHAPIALKQGLKPEIVKAIEDGRRPTGMSEDEETCYDFTTELLRFKSVSDATYARAQKRFGDKGVVDMTAISGYYTFLAMELNVARYHPPESVTPLPRLP
jgi:4-carboxymuconolactone decarboxylase